jgi:hypothetical protein
MSRQVFFASREDMNSGPSDIFLGLSDHCFEKEKHAWTFENKVHNLASGVEGDSHLVPRSRSVVSVQLVHASRGREAQIRLPSSGREGRPFWFPT